jgi:uncharacterized membrane protein
MSRSKGKAGLVSFASNGARRPAHQPAVLRTLGTEQRQARFHQGPFPSGDELAIYEQTVPGAANRIIQMAEEQARHRQDLEKASLTSDSDAREKQLGIEERRIRGIIANERIGQMLGWTIAVCCVTFAGFCALRGTSAITIAMLLSLPLVGVVKAFVHGRPNPAKPEG